MGRYLSGNQRINLGADRGRAQKSPATSRELKQLASKDEAIRPLVERYYAFQAELHGECFYLGFCDPEEETGRRIRATEQFIRDVEALAGQ